MFLSPLGGDLDLLKVPQIVCFFHVHTPPSSTQTLDDRPPSREFSVFILAGHGQAGGERVLVEDE